jgi:cyclopropane fatty-acyl-phospholipid synthase-like methyltransferase
MRLNKPEHQGINMPHRTRSLMLLYAHVFNDSLKVRVVAVMHAYTRLPQKKVDSITSLHQGWHLTKTVCKLYIEFRDLVDARKGKNIIFCTINAHNMCMYCIMHDYEWINGLISGYCTVRDCTLHTSATEMTFACTLSHRGCSFLHNGDLLKKRPTVKRHTVKRFVTHSN